ncbi:hypothetical protein CICLE_v10017410mg [Citrus x clementina]|uniref:Uncharacterized protein n=1 Tax=Citrus clementina TaxID=85681 RepID=V4ULJ8_CITCL|nr:hypothetical protein CICLE_v10017410mg [Citrus x clementina]
MEGDRDFYLFTSFLYHCGKNKSVRLSPGGKGKNEKWSLHDAISYSIPWHRTGAGHPPPPCLICAVCCY